MEEDRVNRSQGAERNAREPDGLPGEVQRVAPAPAPSTSFGAVQMRPQGQRYGDSDLVPGGSLNGGGMVMNERNFRGSGMPLQPGESGSRNGSAADAFARFDPMFPGQRMPGNGVGGGGPRGPPRLPGEPDNDLFLPPQGLPGQPFGGPGGGQFGPRQSGWGSGSPYA